MKNRAVKIAAGFVLAATLDAWCGAVLAQGPVPGPFTHEQVDAGRKGFAENCAECHNKDLSGVSAPALAGKKFAEGWGNKTSDELYKFIKETMPVCQGGILANGAYADIVAFLMWANGAQPGTESFDGKAKVSLGSILTGNIPPDLSKTR